MRGSDGHGNLDNDKTSDENPKFVILRHDVDAWHLDSLQFAKLEHSLGIRGTYCFQTGPNGFYGEIIRQIAELGHEIGYHYETMAQVAKRRFFNSRF